LKNDDTVTIIISKGRKPNFVLEKITIDSNATEELFMSYWNELIDIVGETISQSDNFSYWFETFRDEAALWLLPLLIEMDLPKIIVDEYLTGRWADMNLERVLNSAFDWLELAEPPTEEEFPIYVDRILKATWLNGKRDLTENLYADVPDVANFMDSVRWKLFEVIHIIE